MQNMNVLLHYCCYYLVDLLGTFSTIKVNVNRDLLSQMCCSYCWLNSTPIKLLEISLLN